MKTHSEQSPRRAVWIIADQDSRGIKTSTREILTLGRNLANSLESKLGAVLLAGDLPEEIRLALSKFGVDDIYLVEHPALENFSTEGYVSALAGLINNFRPSLVLISATPDGQDFAPRLAGRLKADIVSNCISLKVNGSGEFQFIKKTYENKVHAILTCPPKELTLVTILPGLIDIDLSHLESDPAVTRWEPSISPEMIRVTRLETIPGDLRQIDIREAEKLVVGGQGVGNRENWELIEELAEKLHAAVGGTRNAVDNGLCAKQRMIGQTSRQVKPLLCFSVGASGSIYHMRGIETENIIALNTDPNAPIFNLCQLGILGDLQEVLPILIDKLQHLETR